MHAALLPNGQVTFLDKIEDYTKLKLPNGQFAYSSEYGPTTNEAVPLAYKTNAFCSGGSFLADGTLLNIGGNAPLTWLDSTVGDGFRGLRYLIRSITDGSLNGEAWKEPSNLLDTPRWYATAQTMPDGTIFVASGSKNGLDPGKPKNNNPTYELLDRDGISQAASIDMELLVKAQPYYMYPFIHLLRDGTLFVFASKFGEIFDVSTNTMIKEFPELVSMVTFYFVFDELTSNSQENTAAIPTPAHPSFCRSLPTTTGIPISSSAAAAHIKASTRPQIHHAVAFDLSKMMPVGKWTQCPKVV